jgi:hypothetical protein
MISYDGEECGAPAGRVRLLVALRWWPVASGHFPLCAPFVLPLMPSSQLYRTILSHANVFGLV